MSCHPKINSLEDDIAAFQSGKLNTNATPVVHLNQNQKNKSNTKQVRFDDNVTKVESVADEKPSTSYIVGNIREKMNIANREANIKQPSKNGFPETFVLDNAPKPAAKLSLFKQAMLKRRGVDANAISISKDTKPSSDSMSPNQSASPKEPRRDFESENDFKIQHMSSEEILAAQDEIKSMFNPEILNKFLSSISSSSSHAAQESHIDVRNSDHSVDSNQLSDPLKNLGWIKTEEDLNTAINMLPAFEKDKLRWTGRVKDDDPTIPPPPPVDNQSIASVFSNEYRPSSDRIRFDFDGNVMESKASVPDGSGLYHHEEEESSPGYTIQELMILAQSSVPAQKTIGLSCIAKVLEKRKHALYARYVDLSQDSPTTHPLFTLPRELPLVLRIALDISNITVVSSALHALVAYFVPLGTIEELNDMVSMGQRWPLPLYIYRAQGTADAYGVALDNRTLTEPSEEENPTDVDWIEESPVRGIVRTGLVARLAFLIGVDPEKSTGVDLPHVDIVQCLSLLCVFAMHSDEVLDDILRTKHLFIHIRQQFISMIRNTDAIVESSDSVQERLAYLRLLTIFALGRKDAARTIADDMKAAGILNDPFMLTLGRSLLEIFGDYGIMWKVDQTLLLAGPLIVQANHLVSRMLLSQDRSDESLKNQAHHNLHVLTMSKPVKDDRYDGEYLISTMALLYHSEKGPVHIWSHQEIQQDLIEQQNANISSNPLHRQQWLPAVVDIIKNMILPSGTRTVDISNYHSLHRYYCAVLALWFLSKWNEMISFVCEEISHSSIIEDIISFLKQTLEYHHHGVIHSIASNARDALLSRCRVLSLRVLNRLHGRYTLSLGVSKYRLAHSCMPSHPTIIGEEYIASEIVHWMLSFDDGVRADDIDQASVQRSYDAFWGSNIRKSAERMGVTFPTYQITSFRIGCGHEMQTDLKSRNSLAKKWDDARSAWPLVILEVTDLFDAPLGMIQQCLNIGVSLLHGGAMLPEDVICELVRFLKVVEPSDLFDPLVGKMLHEILDNCISDILNNCSTGGYLVRLRRAAGTGKSGLVNLWKDLVLVFNESLYGHPVICNLILLMFRMDADDMLRLLLWEDLMGCNMLKLLKPTIERLDKTEDGRCALSWPREEKPEILQVMSRSLCERVVTSTNNAYLYNIILDHLATYIWTSQLSWNRKRILKDIISSGIAYEDLARRLPDGTTSANFHQQAIGILKIIAYEDPLIYDRLQIDGHFEL